MFIFSTKKSLNGMRNINFHEFFHSQRPLRHDLKCLFMPSDPSNSFIQFIMTEAFTLQTLETGSKLKGEIKVIYSTDSGMKSI